MAKNYAEGPGIPLGFGMALAQNAQAMEVFSHLPEAEQKKILDRTHSVSSKQEMRALVDSLAAQPPSPQS